MMLKRTREDFDPRRVEAFSYLDISIGLMEVTADTVGGVPFLQRELWPLSGSL